MQVIDLDDGQVVAEFQTLGTIAAYSTGSFSGYAWANQRVAGVVEIVASGISDSPDGGIVKAAPFVLGDRLTGPKPTHWTSHDDWVISFNDGDGSFTFLPESSLRGTRPLFATAQTGEAHHGVTVISHGNVFASLPDPGDSILPIGVTVRKVATPDVTMKVAGVELKRTDCPLLHGEATSEDVVAFGCGDGVLVAERVNGSFVFRKIDDPEDTPSGRRIGTLRAPYGLDVLIGNWGNGFTIIPLDDPTPTWIQVDLGNANRGFLVDELTEHLVVLRSNGMLQRFNSTTGAPVGTQLSIVEPEATGDATSALTLGYGMAFVADPRTGKVHEIDLVAWTKGRTFDVGGNPKSLAAFGRSIEE